MKEITKEIVTTEVCGYVAEDGTRFCNRDACLEYEKSKAFALKKMYNTLVIGHLSEEELFDVGCSDCDVDIVLMKSIEDLALVDAYIVAQTHERSTLSNEDIGIPVLINWGYECDYAWIMGTLENYLTRVQGHYNRAVENYAKRKEEANA